MYLNYLFIYNLEELDYRYLLLYRLKGLYSAFASLTMHH